ncbi:ATP-binding protein [Rhizobium sp. SL42]|uniref:ATP-binding protein n=1 Tax=Rhizobium sp. SL42 TaxID=2806346 RepID=UPI001F0116F2|nr:NB-ARC domain-containing protein [Rhizobium sp. SL42]UJW77159.1 ATPase [Rhizobium sp. SL42]
MDLLQNPNLPTLHSQVFGREGEIESFAADLMASPLVSIVGPGGVGKTTVAIEVAKAVHGQFVDGVCFVDFATLQDPAMVPVAIAEALGLKTGASPVLDSVCASLRDREMLLLLDNCEHVVETAATSAYRILSAASGVRILATSREPLGVNGERVRALGGLSFPPEPIGVRAQDALMFPAIQLFVERAKRRKETFALRDQDAPAAAEICRRLDGIALAIELAGTRVDTFSVDGILEQLDDRFRALVGPKTATERHRSLVATLDWSFELLSPGEAELLNAMSVFAGAFSGEDAAAVAGTSTVDAVERLAQIAAKSLVTISFAGDRTWYRLLETTRSYCVMHLRATRRLDAMQRRHAERVHTILRTAGEEWRRTPAGDWGKRYRSVLQDLRIALVWAEARDQKLLIELTTAATILWNHFSLTEECREAILRAIGQLNHLGLEGTATEMRLQTFLSGAAVFTRGPGPEMLMAAERALDIATALDDTEFQLRSLWTLGSYKIFAGKYDEAFDHMKAFLAIAEAKDRTAVPGGEAMLATAEFYVGDLDNALRRVEAHFNPNENALEKPRLARFQFVSNSTFGVILSITQWNKGWPGRAARTIERVVQDTLRTGHKMEIASSLVMSGCLIALLRNNRDDARRYLDILDHVLDESGLEVWRPVALHYRGALMCSEEASLSEGLEMLKTSLRGLDSKGQKLRRAYFLGVLAEALAKAGHMEEAISTIETALAISGKNNERWCLPELLRIHGSVLLAQARPAEAESRFIRSMTVAGDLGMLSWQLRAANDLAEFWQTASRGHEAYAMLMPIYSRFAADDDTGDLRRAHLLLQATQ